MTYTLARLRSEKPTPPFRLGGEFAGGLDRAHLRDAHGLVSLKGDQTLLGRVRDGDLIECTVTAFDAEVATVADLAVVHRWRPGFRLPHRPRAARFTAFTNGVREYFLGRGLSEIFTPTLVTCPGLEPSLEPFVTEATRGSTRERRFLPTSPEVSLKKALASGWTDIFEVKSVFRRGEYSEHHAPEFLMLEWYRAFADLDLIEEDLRALLAHLSRAGFGDVPTIETTDFQSLYRELYGFTLIPRTTRDELAELASRLGVETAADDTFADVFNRLMVDRLEAELAKRGPVIVRRFPPSMAALAKLDADGWADRLEFYWRGLEIANGFNEVTDPVEQAKRWAFERAERARLGTSEVPDDPELIAALEAGSPPAGGIALGVERLFMAMARVARIGDVRLF